MLRVPDRVYRAIIEDGKVKDEENPNLDAPYNKMVKKITSDYENLSFNTAVSEMMIFINAVYKEDVLPRKYAEGFVKVLNPIAPHVTDEPWPEYDESKLVEDTYEMVVQVNGKVRGKITVSTDSTDEEMKKAAKEIDNVKTFIDGKEIVKEIVVPKKLVNIVVK